MSRGAGALHHGRGNAGADKHVRAALAAVAVTHNGALPRLACQAKSTPHVPRKQLANPPPKCC